MVEVHHRKHDSQRLPQFEQQAEQRDRIRATRYRHTNFLTGSDAVLTREGSLQQACQSTERFSVPTRFS
jgi:hypothetical protein